MVIRKCKVWTITVIILNVIFLAELIIRPFLMTLHPECYTISVLNFSISFSIRLWGHFTKYKNFYITPSVIFFSLEDKVPAALCDRWCPLPCLYQTPPPIHGGPFISSLLGSCHPAHLLYSLFLSHTVWTLLNTFFYSWPWLKLNHLLNMEDLNR